MYILENWPFGHTAAHRATPHSYVRINSNLIHLVNRQLMRVTLIFRTVHQHFENTPCLVAGSIMCRVHNSVATNAESISRKLKYTIRI